MGRVIRGLHFYSFGLLRRLYDWVMKWGESKYGTWALALNSFAESLAGRISQHCFEKLDAPVQAFGAVSLPAIPLNVELEKKMLPNAEKVKAVLLDLLAY